jgi:hypothetical protein
MLFLLGMNRVRLHGDLLYAVGAYNHEVCGLIFYAIGPYFDERAKRKAIAEVL